MFVICLGSATTTRCMFSRDFGGEGGRTDGELVGSLVLVGMRGSRQESQGIAIAILCDLDVLNAQIILYILYILGM